MAQTIDGTERANELYWSSSRTVDDIVTDLGISRSALYATIEPVPAGLVCADCNERMVHGNRTMRDRGVAVCPSCGRESAADTAAEGGGSEGAAVGDEEWEAGGAVAGDDGYGDALERNGDPFTRWDALRLVTPQRLALVGGAAALGIVAGAAITQLLRN